MPPLSSSDRALVVVDPDREPPVRAPASPSAAVSTPASRATPCSRLGGTRATSGRPTRPGILAASDTDRGTVAPSEERTAATEVRRRYVPALAEVTFPAARWQLVTAADLYGADIGTRALLERLPVRTYPSMNAVLATLIAILATPRETTGEIDPGRR